MNALPRVLFLVATLFLASVVLFSVPATAQEAPPAIERSLGTFQGDWYKITLTDPTVLKINMTVNFPFDDVGIFIYDRDLSTTYDPDEVVFAVSGSRTFGFTTFAGFEFPAAFVGDYTLQIIGFNIVTDDRIQYHLESNIPLEFVGTTHFMSLTFSGLNQVYQANVTSSFLDQPVEQEAFTAWFGWADDSTILSASQTIPVSDNERYHTRENTAWTVVETEDRDVIYFHQYLSSISTVGLPDDVPLNVAFASDGLVRNDQVLGRWSDWVDEGRSVTVPRTLDISRVERYTTPEGIVLRVDSPIDASLRYYHQWLVTTNQIGLDEIAIEFSSMGERTNEAVSSGSAIWIDHGSSISIDREIPGETPLERWVSNRESWIVSSDTPIDLKYIKQYLPTLVIRGLGEYPASIQFSQGGALVSGFSSSSWSEWVDAGSTVRVESSISGKPGERWIAEDQTSFEAGPVGSTIDYRREVSISMVFLDVKGIRILPQDPSRVIIVDPQGAEMELSSFSGIWVTDSAWRVKSIRWEGIDLAPAAAFSFLPEAGGAWTIPTRVYGLSFQVADLLGVPIRDASVLLTMPNDLKLAKSTDAAGVVSFDVVPDGEYQVKVVYLGQEALLEGTVSQDSDRERPLLISFSYVVITSIVLLIVLITIPSIILVRRNRSKTDKSQVNE